MRDLADRTPGHGLIEKLLAEWDAGRIRLDEHGEVAIDEESRSWYWGVLGELRVAEALGASDVERVVLHSVPIGTRGADVDHVVLTPGGVFTINTKYSSGSSVWTAGHGLRVNGTQQPYLHRSAREATRVAGLLSRAAGFAVPVHPVLAFVGISGLTRTAPNEVDGVTVRVVRDTELTAVLDHRRELSAEQFARVVEAARRPSTWSATTVSSRPGSHLAKEFQALRTAVGPALESTRARTAPAPKKERLSVRRGRSASIAPAARRPPRTRSAGRRRRSIGEELGRLVIALAGLAGVWFYVTYLYQPG